MVPQRIKRSKSPEQALSALMRLCARAEKCSGDALRLMRGWGVEPAAQQHVLRQLQQQRFIDDERYAAAFVREKMRLSGWGGRKIRAALVRKGIAEALIAGALAQADPEAAGPRLHEQLVRKARTTRCRTPFELKTKLIRYGLSLGYEYETVLDEANKLAGDAGPEPCSDF